MAYSVSASRSVNSFINHAIDKTLERDNSVLPDNIDKQKEPGSTLAIKPKICYSENIKGAAAHKGLTSWKNVNVS